MNSKPSPSPRRHFHVAAAFAALVVLALLYAWAIEPYWIEVTHHTVRVPSGVEFGAPLKIAHLSDLHTAGLRRRERKLLELLALEKPDLIVITGDTLAGAGTYRETRELLSQLRAPLGIYVVRGNWENWVPPGNEREHYRLAGAQVLVNEGAAPRPDVWLAGVDDPGSGVPNLDAALNGAPASALRIALFHSPEYFDSIASRVHLAFAGHTHGGQVRFPPLPPLWMPNGSGRFVAGWYEKDDARMYVSRGVGTSIMPLRFACRPEVAIIAVTSGE